MTNEKQITERLAKLGITIEPTGCDRWVIKANGKFRSHHATWILAVNYYDRFGG